MTHTEIGLLLIAIAFQLGTVWLWRNARADADTHYAMFLAAYDQLAELHRNSIRRDPRTGRYMKKGF